MRVAIVGKDDQGGGSLAASFAAGVRECGHEAILVDAASLVEGRRPLIVARRRGLERAVAAPLVRRLHARLRAYKPDLVLVTKGRFIGRRAVLGLRRALDCSVVNYHPDHPLWPGYDEREVLEALRAYDEVVVWGAHVADALAGNGVRSVRVVPFGYDPVVYRPPEQPLPQRWEVSFIGQCYPNRVAYAEAVADRAVLVTGLGWRRATERGPLADRAGDQSFSGSDTCKLYWQSAVALNILAPWNAPAHNMRSFEIPASGTPMVATRTPEHEAIFGEDGPALVSEPEEARAVVLELLADPDRRRRMAAVALEQVRPHTYAARMAELLGPYAI